MPSNKKISELTEFTAAQLADDDLIVMVDVSDSTTKKVAASTFRATVAGVESLTAVAPLSVDAPNGDVTIQITDPLPIANGGTAATTASVARTNLGLGTIATQNSNSVSITGGAISGITDLAIADGGTGASTAADARTNLGVTATGADTTYAYRANNLSDLANAATARTNLGVTATGADTTYAYRANNLSDLASASTARTNLGLGTIATQDASNVSITGGSISGITDLAVADGGTGASNAAAARTNLGAAASGANSDITSLTGLTTPLSVPQGGTGATTLTSNNVILGNGSSAVQFVAPGTSGNVLTSNGTTWLSTASASSGVASFSAGTTGFTPSTATTGAITLAGTLAIANGGTGATSSSTAATALGVGTGDSPTFAGLNIDTNLGVDGQWNTSGLTVYANGVTPQHDGPLHVMSGSAGAVTASTAADELIVEGPGNAAGGISILNADANDCNIFFGNASDNLAAMVQWNYTSKLLALSTRTTGGYLRFGVEDEGYRGEWNTTGLTCYASGVTPQHDSVLHVMKASAGTVTAGSQHPLVVEMNSGGTGAGISLLNADAGYSQIAMGSPTNSEGFEILYRYNDSAAYIRTKFAGASLIFASGNSTTALTLNSSQQATFAGSVTVNAASSSISYIKQSTTTADQVILSVEGSAGNIAADIRYGSGGAPNTAGTNMRINRNNSTSRSINAAGTVNASGADYAEYERKRHDCGNVPKGAVVGFDANGLVTDKWSASVRFGVKSTDPSYVGGDVWGTPDAIGLAEPVAPSTPQDDSDAWRQYIVDRTAYDVALEGARQTVDRIAYAGKCPVNIVGAPVGSWIIAEGTVDDKIACVYVASLTTEDYAQTNTLMERCVGRVNKILPDGRAEIVVRP